jgi:hypothetical protein
MMPLGLSVVHVVHTAAGLLGPAHPLVRVLNQMTVRVEQSVVVLTAMLAGGVGLAAGVSQALALIAGAAVVQGALMGSLAILVSDRRAHVRDLIIDGRDSLPLAVVQRERRRLLTPGHRLALARSLDELRHEAEHPVLRPSWSPPLYAPRVLRTVAPQLAEASRLLRPDGVSPAGVAMTDRLLGGHDSPLYGRDPRRLSEELHRIVVALRRRDEPRVAATSVP